MIGTPKKRLDSIPASDIRAELERVLESEGFKRSPKLSGFLEFIVEQTLKGSADRLKGYTIGIEVLGKPDTFDPELDASVRVDATRLRRALAAYFSGAGRDDAISISVPSGTYVPSFERRSVSAPATENRTITGVLAALALVILGAALGAFFLFLWSGNRLSGLTGDRRPPIEQILERTTGPTVAILPLKAIGDEDAVQLANGFTHQLLTDLTRFQSLRVLGRETVKGSINLGRDSADIGSKLQADYVIAGSLQRAGEKTSIKINLLDVSSGSYIWSYSSDENIRPDNIFDVQTKVVGEIAARLGQPYGVFQRWEARKLARAEKKTFASYKCVLDYYDYAGNRSAQKHAQVRDCLERAVEQTPDYTDAWALLSAIYGDEIRYGYNLGSSAEDARKRSAAAAKKALEANPESPRAHQYAGAAALLANDSPGARRHLRLALRLNPNDADILANAGWAYAQLGDWELGKSLVEKAIWLNPGHPRWYLGILFAYQYRLGNYEDALTYALAYYQPDVLLASVALTAVYGKLGQLSEAEQAAKNLKAKFPKFVSAPKSALSGWHFPDAFIDNLLDGLRAAGLEFEATG